MRRRAMALKKELPILDRLLLGLPLLVLLELLPDCVTALEVSTLGGGWLAAAAALAAD